MCERAFRLLKSGIGSAKGTVKGMEMKRERFSIEDAHQNCLCELRKRMDYVLMEGGKSTERRAGE